MTKLQFPPGSAIHVHPYDSVAVALRPLVADEVLGVTLRDAIGQGHKFAVQAHAAGEGVTK